MKKDKYLKLSELQQSENIAESLSESQLATICSSAVQGFEIDKRSRSEWEEIMSEAMKIAKQIYEPKQSVSGDHLANVKFPLITHAAMSFAAREFPEIVKDNSLVKAYLVGNTNELIQYRAQKVAKFMSYQLLFASTEWETEMDRLLHVLPVLGTVFKKVYYNTYTRTLCTELCLPDKIVINQNATSIESARRVSHCITSYKNDIIENIRRGIYSNIDESILVDNDADSEDEDAPIHLIEQHCWYDLDGDGYAEPYIVTFHKDSQTILRIVQRFDDVEKKGDKVICIKAKNYFVDYHFMRDPAGGFYSVGFGTMLYPLNDAINSIINQLIDSGTLANSQAGFIGSAIKMREGEQHFKLGEWKFIQNRGESLAANIVPLPTKEPSGTLFQLLGLLIGAGKDLANINEMMEGTEPGQNMPATTSLTLIEQGMKVFNATHKRIFTSLKKEFEIIFELNKENLTNSEYRGILNDPVAEVKLDFDIKSKDIVPVADPFMASDAQRLVKAQAVMSVPGLNTREQLKFYLESLKLDPKQVQVLLPPEEDPSAPPPPEVLKLMAEVEKLKAETMALQGELQIKNDKNMIEGAKLHAKVSDSEILANESMARVEKMRADAEHNTVKNAITAGKAAREADRKDFEAQDRHEGLQLDSTLKVFQAMQKNVELGLQRQKDTADTAVKLKSIEDKPKAAE